MFSAVFLCYFCVLGGFPWFYLSIMERKIRLDRLHSESQIRGWQNGVTPILFQFPRFLLICAPCSASSKPTRICTAPLEQVKRRSSTGTRLGVLLVAKEKGKEIQESTPDVTGRRFHRATEAIPRGPWKAKNPFASRPLKTSIKRVREGCA